VVSSVDLDRLRLDTADAKHSAEPVFSHHGSPANRDQRDIRPSCLDQRFSSGRVLARNDEQVGWLTDGNLSSIRKLQHTRGGSGHHLQHFGWRDRIGGQSGSHLVEQIT
jgi:hypothetical protein